MNEIERELIEEYKRLDLLLKDMFQSDTGVSEYISRMESCIGDDVPGWKHDLKKLKRVRHIRNKIMHDEDDSLCMESDIDYVLDFYDRLMERDDPLSKLHDLRSSSQKKAEYDDEPQDWSYLERSSSGRLTVILLILLFFACIAIILELLFFRTKGFDVLDEVSRLFG